MQQNMDVLTERFEDSLHALWKNLRSELIKRTHLNLTPDQVIMLHFIQQEGPCNVSKLAETLEVAPSAITIMLDRLEDHGFVRRTRDKADRRVVVAELTHEGEKKLNHGLDVRKQITQYCLKQLEMNELESFIRTLESLASIAQTMDTEIFIGLSGEER